MTRIKETIEDRFWLLRRRGGGYTATIKYRKEYYSCKIEDATLWDDYHECHIFNTRKQAIHIMYNEVKRVNNLK